MFHAKREASFLDSEVRDLRNKFARFDNDGSGERLDGREGVTPTQSNKRSWDLDGVCINLALVNVCNSDLVFLYPTSGTSDCQTMPGGDVFQKFQHGKPYHGHIESHMRHIRRRQRNLILPFTARFPNTLTRFMHISHISIHCMNWIELAMCFIADIMIIWVSLLIVWNDQRNLHYERAIVIHNQALI